MSEKSAEKLIYGFHAVLARLRHDPAGVREIYLDLTRRDARARDLVHQAKDAGVRLAPVEADRLERLVGKAARHQGVVARVRPLAPRHSLDDVLDDAAAAGIAVGRWHDDAGQCAGTSRGGDQAPRIAHPSAGRFPTVRLRRPRHNDDVTATQGRQDAIGVSVAWMRSTRTLSVTPRPASRGLCRFPAAPAGGLSPAAAPHQRSTATSGHASRPAATANRRRRAPVISVSCDFPAIVIHAT
jgi:hypothetical protein